MNNERIVVVGQSAKEIIEDDIQIREKNHELIKNGYLKKIIRML